MFKIIFRNLWSRRGLNGWLTAELILVTILSWIMIDQIAVMSYDFNCDLGYDQDRLVCIKTKFDAAENVRKDDYDKLIHLLCELPEVESATVCSNYAYPESSGQTTRSLRTETDTIYSSVLLYYADHTNYFETLGIRSVEGSPTVEELSDMVVPEPKCIITKDLATRLFKGENPIGKTMTGGWDNEKLTVVGVVDNVRAYSRNRNANTMFCTMDNRIHGAFLVRLKKGVDSNTFAKNFALQRQNFVSGALSLGTAESLLSCRESSNLLPVGEYNLKKTLLMFFLINLCLGVIGTFWLQTQQRASETAIMKTFGAKRLNIVFMLMGEGLVLTVVGTVIGCLIYLQYAFREGLYPGFMESLYGDWKNIDILECWVNNFGEHFMIVSGIVFVMMLIFVIIGILTPAIKISGVKPADALHND